MHSALLTKRLFLNLSLFSLLLASCAPTVVTTESPPQPAPASVIEPSATPAADVPDVESASTEINGPTPLPVATSRGPDLQATDPNTVNLASGRLQLVEFFRFT